MMKKVSRERNELREKTRLDLAWLPLLVVAIAVGALLHHNRSVLQPAMAQSQPPVVVYLSDDAIVKMKLDGSDKTLLVGAGISNACGRPALSPDGQKVAYVQKHLLYIINVDGSAKIRLTDASNSAYAPVWAGPDKIVFLCAPKVEPVNATPGKVRSKAGNSVCIINSDGSGLKNLTQDESVHLLPSASADGSKIAFISSSSQWWMISAYRPELIDKVRLSLINSDGSGLLVLNEQASPDQPSFSPDGQQIAFTTALSPMQPGHIALINVDGTGLKPLTTLSGMVPDLNSGRDKLQRSIADAGPIFSPDGRHIVFVSTRDGQPQIYQMNRDGSGQKRLGNGQGPDVEPVFAPDGQHIIFTSLRNFAEDNRFISPVYNRDEEIYLMNADGSGQQRLTETWTQRPTDTNINVSQWKRQHLPSSAPDVR